MADCDEKEESSECRNARRLYDVLAAQKVRVESDINKLVGETNNANNTAIGAGTLTAAVGVLVMISNPVGWVIGIGLGLVFVGGVVTGYFLKKGDSKGDQLNNLRDFCKFLLEEMIKARDEARAACANPNCAPPMPSACV